MGPGGDSQFSQRAMDIYAKNFFLTYPRCELHPEYALTAFRNLPHSEHLEWAHVVQEEHEDGGFHLHAVLHYSKRVRIRDAEYFDLHYGDECFHGNYQASKNVKHSLKYIRKDPILEASYGAVPFDGNNPWAVALDSAKSAEDFCAQIRAADPMRFVLYNDKVESFAIRAFGGNPSGFDPVRDLGSFHVPAVLNDWYSQQLMVCSALREDAPCPTVHLVGSTTPLGPSVLHLFLHLLMISQVQTDLSPSFLLGHQDWAKLNGQDPWDGIFTSTDNLTWDKLQTSISQMSDTQFLMTFPGTPCQNLPNSGSALNEFLL